MRATAAPPTACERAIFAHDGLARPGAVDHAPLRPVRAARAFTRHAAGDGFVTVIVDLTAVVAGTGRARLLDLVAGRSAAAFAGWLG